MKEGWEVKKIKDICDKASSNIVQNKITDLSGDYPVFGASGYVQNVDFYHRDKQYIGVVKDGSGVGRVNLYPAYSSLLGTLQYILPKEGYLINYVAYALKGLNLAKFVSGAAIPHIYFKDYGEERISVPPFSEQSQIVEELDQLSNIIEKKRQQLSELDNLAQSIFYDMFGDPVTNEKGWEVKKLGEVCEPKSKIIRANKQYLSKDKIRYIDISSIDNSCNTITHTNVMNFGDAPSRAQQIVLIGDVLVSLVRPNLRNIALISYDYDDLVASTGFCVLRTIEIINSYYLLYCVLGENFTDYLMERTSGANYPAVREEDIKGYDLCIPPLSLQQLFAQKIEAIEKEKELIKQSIKETEELFNSRMAYYFG